MGPETSGGDYPAFKKRAALPISQRMTSRYPFLCKFQNHVLVDFTRESLESYIYSEFVLDALNIPRQISCLTAWQAIAKPDWRRNYTYKCRFHLSIYPTRRSLLQAFLKLYLAS